MALARKLTKKIYEIHAHTPKAVCLDIGATGRVLVTGGHDRNIKLWALGNDECFMILEGHNGAVDCVKFAHNDDYVFSADENGIIKKWNLNTSEEETTLYGHMKSVKTLHFHPFGDYVVSGSNDTSIRLWDIRTRTCIKKYNGHISHVNSVKFSPDGTWIASAGSEGSVIIWDIRMSKQLTEFTDHSAAITCIEYHPYEFLLAAGRSDGKVDFYDLEKNKLISPADKRPCMGSAVRVITFSENGQCLFAGTADDIGVVGWEPDKEYDRVEGTWCNVGDIKSLGNKLYVGGYENENVSIHVISLNQVMPFYNPTNKPFSHNQSSRKSFSNRTGKLRLSIGNKIKSSNDIENGEKMGSTDGGSSSPNLSIEMIDEEGQVSSLEAYSTSQPHISLDQMSVSYAAPYQMDKYLNTQNNLNTEKYQSLSGMDYTSDLDYYPTRSSPGMSNVIEPEREDFPVNTAQSATDYNTPRMNNVKYDPEPRDFPVNNAVPPDYAPKLNTMTITKTVVSRAKLDTNVQKRHSQGNIMNRTNMNMHGMPSSNKLKMSGSVSSMELNKLDDNLNLTLRKPISRGASPVRSIYATNQMNRIKKSESSTQFNRDRENNKNKHIPVHIVTKPIRSKTAIDMKSAAGSVATSSSSTSNNHHQNYHPHKMSNNFGSDMANETHEIQLMTTCHESVFQSLQNRHTSLQILRTMRSQDLHGTIKNVSQMNNPSVLVDIMGVITESSIPMNLDVCVAILPEIYELLRSEYHFHYTRACDMLRTILTKFLPTIRENCDPYGPARSLGVDISREERQNKCIECKQWLLRIRCLTDNQQFGSTLTQLQNMIVDL